MRLDSRLLPAVALALSSLTACGSPEINGADESITVFAASSLTNVFTDLGREFANVRPDIAVTFNFAGSTELSTQISEGAPADVFAAADPDSMAAALGDDPTTTPVIFARNSMEIAVPAGNPATVAGLADLVRDDVVVVLCDPTVPCGRYARAILGRAGLAVKAASLESNVKAVVTKISLGEADAGIVYATDVRAAGGEIEGVVIPGADNITVDYPIAPLTDAPAARAFVDFVSLPAGREILLRHGFKGG